MSGTLDEFIPLDRTFHDLAFDPEKGDEAQAWRPFLGDQVTTWKELLNEPRVVLLCEAGAGKTEEIRHTCRRLRAEGKPAFFLRIEHVVAAFDGCFEDGVTLAEFEQWTASGAEGWLFLDSVDEARLQDVLDFERAVRMLGVRLRSVLQRAHILITSRSEAWRPMTDLRLCKREFAWHSPKAADDKANGSDPGADRSGQKKASEHGPFRIVSLDDLHGTQIDRFASAKGITNVKAFRAELQQADAESIATRPLDLTEIIKFRLQHGRIGSPLELVQNSIARRLDEHDQNHSEAKPLSLAKAREGARLMAAAATLCKESAIRIPDGRHATKGLSVKDLLPHWSESECLTLIGRPIFEPGIYGTVRFHHSRVREYLTAEWLQCLLASEVSPLRIERLFFREQYGIDVTVPTLRKVLPWLAILDSRMLGKIIQHAPEVLTEGGDPSRLPLATRREVLRQTCEQLAQPAHDRNIWNTSAIQHFADTDLANDIRSLLDHYAEDEEIAGFLLRMVWLGKIRSLVDRAKQFALDSRAQYARATAIRVVLDLGTATDAIEVRQVFLLESEPLQRRWLAQLLDGLPTGQNEVAWLLAALERAAPKQGYSTHGLSDALLEYIEQLSTDRLAQLVDGLDLLLRREPVTERRHCEISERHGWLARAAAHAVGRLIEGRSPAALAPAALRILRLLPIVKDYSTHLFEEPRKDLPESVRAWPELNRALFWHCVGAERAYADAAKDERVTDYWAAGVVASYWAFTPAAFESVCEDVTQRPHPDDRLVALTLAFALYVQQGRPAPWLGHLEALVTGDAELEAKLRQLLEPPPKEAARWKRLEAERKRRQKREAAKRADALKKAQQDLSERLPLLRTPADKGYVRGEQRYLLDHLRNAESQHNHWTDGRWEILIETFGKAVARAFADGAIAYWRDYEPKLRSEGASANSTPQAVVLGLVGLAIEAREQADWPRALTAVDAQRATRYALHELNGFPPWLPRLHEAFPEVVTTMVLGEIEHELATETAADESHYVLSDVSWQGRWLWDRLAPALLQLLQTERRNATNLGYLLAILQGSSVGDDTIAALASSKAKTIRDPIFSSIWFAVWVGVEPDAAIPALATRLAELDPPADRTQLALRFLMALAGSSSQQVRPRLAYRQVGHMKDLYLLTLRYVRQQDDIDRVGKGVYSPELRDHAQRARDSLFAYVREMPGKEAFLALREMALVHPDAESRPWMSHHAKSKAATDADLAAWSPTQVRDFNATLTRTPANHRELWDLAVERLEALKHDLEDGDASNASILLAVKKETEVRNFIGGWCRDREGNFYRIVQEEEMADAKRPDLRFLSTQGGAPVPVEIKVADKWPGPRLFERFDTQLCGDYLRDVRSSRGIFVLVHLGKQKRWHLPSGGRVESFEALLAALRQHWKASEADFPKIEDVAVIGIDLTRRRTAPKPVTKAVKGAKRRATASVPKPRAKRSPPRAAPKPVAKVAKDAKRGTATKAPKQRTKRSPQKVAPKPVAKAAKSAKRRSATSAPKQRVKRSYSKVALKPAAKAVKSGKRRTTTSAPKPRAKRSPSNGAELAKTTSRNGKAAKTGSSGGQRKRPRPSP